MAIDEPRLSLQFGEMLQYAAGHYISHTNWFLRHKEAGFTSLATALTAEVAVVGFVFSDNVPKFVGIAALLIIAILSIPLTVLALRSCVQAYRAALEHAALVTKVVWAAGLASSVRKIPLDEYEQVPLRDDDPQLFVPRYITDTCKYATTDEFVNDILAKKGMGRELHPSMVAVMRECVCKPCGVNRDLWVPLTTGGLSAL